MGLGVIEVGVGALVRVCLSVCFVCDCKVCGCVVFGLCVICIVKVCWLLGCRCGSEVRLRAELVRGVGVMCCFLPIVPSVEARVAGVIVCHFALQPSDKSCSRIRHNTCV